MTLTDSLLRLPSLGGVVTRAWRANRPLTFLVAAMVGVLLLALAGLVVDVRVITGAPAWLKPAKFALSIGIYGATLLWLLSFIRNRPILVSLISWAVLLLLGVEMAIIAVQVVRGTTSHFNGATDLDGTLFQIMGSAIVVVWLLGALVAVLLMRRDFAAPPIVWGVRIGLVAALVGMAVAFFMIGATPEQEAAIAQTGFSPIEGGHAVGVVDGGPGLPIVGWSTEGGDMRAPHFIGMHALQILPLLGIGLARFAPNRLSMRRRGWLTVIAGVAWIGLILVLTWQALRGQSVIAPDGLTLGALGALVVLTAGAALAVVRWKG